LVHSPEWYTSIMSFLRPGQPTQEQVRETSPRAPERRNLKRMNQFEFSQSLKRNTLLATYFTDPTTGERTPTNRPPDCVLQDQEFKDGYDFFKEFGDRVNLEVMLAPHRKNSPEENFGDASFDFEGKVRDADIILFEGLGWTQKEKDLLNTLSTAGETATNEQDLLAYIDNDTSKIRRLRAINETGKKIGFFDVENKDDEIGIRQKIIENSAYLNTVLAVAPVVDGLSPEEAKLAKNMQMAKEIVPLEAIREWCMVAGAGNQVTGLITSDQAVQRKFLDSKLKVLMVVGKSHKDLIRKFKTTTVKVSSSSPAGESAPIDEKWSEWVAQGFIDNAELKRLSV